jgi:arylsulfatase A-like enzyme
MNVLVISVDALRTDRLARNGHPRPLTPNLDALLASGTVFENAWTTYPFTVMAFGSAFRGVYASATDGWKYREAGLKAAPPPTQPTLARILGDRGWRTEAVVGFPRFVREILRNEEGFTHFNAHMDARAKDRSLVAAEVTSLAIDALDRDPETPFLLWAHYFDPHAPYEPPPPHPFGESKPDLYDAEILYADREIGRLLDAVRARDLGGSTAIVVFSDHGEDLKEFDHGTALTEEQIHVPLALVLPRVPPRVVTRAVDLTDLVPTILELVGIARPPHVHGQSLVACALLDENQSDPAAFPPDLAFCELGGAALPQARQFAAREGRMKIICHADSQTYSLFDLANDPGETRDLSGDAPDVLARMKRVLDSFRALR